MRDLSISFCGVPCENPFFLGSSCISGTEEMCARALEAGWGGLVYKTIGFYQAREVSPRFDAIMTQGRFAGFRNLEQISEHPLEENLEAISHLAARFPDKVIVSSIMGETPEEWEQLARLSEQAGAAIIECNFSCPQMAKKAMGADVGVSPALVERACRAVRRGTHLPVLAKMTPNITDMTIPARAAIAGGATGLAAINTVKSLTHVGWPSLKDREGRGGLAPDVAGSSCVSGYSGPAVRPIALRFVSELARDEVLASVPISGIGGVVTWRDARSFLLLGARNVQVATAVMEYGYRIIDDLIEGLADDLEARGLTLEALIGSALPSLRESAALDRATQSLPVFDAARCVGCGRCYLSCRDGGHQAISWEAAARRPVLDGARCVGCQLCRLVCPAAAIAAGPRQRRAAAG